jgi:hypothetical protein
MMLEDTLIYNPPQPHSYAALLQTDLEEDGLEFYLRMSGDIGTVAADTNRPALGADLGDLLLTALVATPAGRPAAWRQFYRGVRTLVSGFAPVVASDARGDLRPAFTRLRQFVRENADLADRLAIVELKRAAYCRAVSA